MSKKNGKKDDEERANRRLTRAQEELQRAQARRTLAMSKGEKEVEVARARAALRVERATRRVERHAASVARAQARLEKHQAPSARSVAVHSPGAAATALERRAADAPPSTPQDVADALQRIEDSNMAGKPGNVTGRKAAGSTESSSANGDQSPTQ